MKINSLLIVMAVTLVFIACKPTQTLTSKEVANTPASFGPGADSTAVKIQSWREFIFDKHLSALIDSSLKSNFDLKVAMHKVEVSRAGIKFTRGIRLPEISVLGSVGQRKFGEYTMDGVGNYDTQFSPNISREQQIPNPLPDYFVGVQSSWEIDLYGKLRSKKTAAAARFIASEYGRDLVLTNLIAEVSATYFELLALDQEMIILETNIDLQQSALDMVVIQKQTGKANELGVELMRAQLLNSKTILSEVRQKRLECESKINYLCGVYPGEVKRDSTLHSNHIMNAVKTGVPGSLLINRPDIKQAEMELKATRADVKAARTAFYPSLNINAFLGLQSFNALLLLETPASIAYNAAGSLAAPLLNRRRLKADLLASKSEQKIAYVNYEKSVVNGFMEVYNALNAIKNTNEMYETKSEEVEVLKQSVITASELFKAGRANYMEVIMAQKNALQSQLELVNYKKKQNVTMINLYRSLGGGWK